MCAILHGYAKFLTFAANRKISYWIKEGWKIREKSIDRLKCTTCSNIQFILLPYRLHSFKNLNRSLFVEFLNLCLTKLLLNPPKKNDSPLDIKLVRFTEVEPDIVLKKFKAEKLLASMKYLLKCWRQENLPTYFFDYPTQCIKNTIERLHLPLFRGRPLNH